jgi:stearoyl-CoA desaturase (Delta-9 desaturase)
MHTHTAGHKALVLAAVIIPFLGLVAAIVLSWGTGIDKVSFGLFAGLSVLTILGITVGYHRLFTHKSFKTIPSIKVLFGILGSMAVEGKVFTWVADHRRHHVHSDGPGDPHSPTSGRKGLWGAFTGFIHSHIGWMLSDTEKNHHRYIPDLVKDKAVAFVNKYFPLWVLLGLLLPALLGLLLTQSWKGMLMGFLWGGGARIFFVHHTTWSINSICHIFGSRPFVSKDHSRNNFVLTILALGEGAHHNHHVFERSAKHGLFWWQFDASYEVIRFLEDLGLAWDIIVPSEAEIERRLVRLY